MKNIPTDVSYLSLEEQLRKLKDEHTCTVCTDRNFYCINYFWSSSTVFFLKYPSFKGTIKGTVNAFFVANVKQSLKCC